MSPPFPSADELKQRVATALQKPGDTVKLHRDDPSSCYLTAIFTRLSAEENARLSAQPVVVKTTSHSYTGSGKACPLCSGQWRLLSAYTSSDGYCGVERGTWHCAHCSVKRDEDSETYGTIFW
jgi:hypothetical protein